MLERAVGRDFVERLAMRYKLSGAKAAITVAFHMKDMVTVLKLMMKGDLEKKGLQTIDIQMLQQSMWADEIKSELLEAEKREETINQIRTRMNELLDDVNNLDDKCLTVYFVDQALITNIRDSFKLVNPSQFSKDDVDSIVKLVEASRDDFFRSFRILNVGNQLLDAVDRIYFIIII